MEKRMILAIALSLIVILAFQLLGPKKKAVAPMIAPVKSEEAPVTAEQAMPEKAPADTERARSEKAPAVIPRSEELTVIETEQYTLVFSDIGGSLKELSLKKYLDDGREEVLVKAEDPAFRPFSLQSALAQGLETRKFRRTRTGDTLEYKATEPGWLEITKTYTIHKSFDYIELQVRVKNLSNRKIAFSYQMTGPSGMERSGRIMGRSFIEADTMIDGSLWKAKAAKGGQERTGNIAWTGLKNRYFALILRPFVSPRAVSLAEAPGKNLRIAVDSRSVDLDPGVSTEEQYLFYAGPLAVQRIAPLGAGMEQIVDYGFFGGVSKVLLKVLRFFHSGVRNWGVAIILLTLLINVILFPLTRKSFHSMQQMKKVQPHMQKLKELHKDNPQKLNKEMMELYRQYNVNPLGGCLPLLLQMPIFIALYQGLVRSVELKGASFLWIKDLARPDAVPLPFSLPLIGASINILPLLMVGMMVVQQKISQGLSAGSMTDEQAQQQKMMMVMFPLFFGFLFYKMPSGLVLYWLTNTILMTSEQALILKHMGDD